MLDLGIRNAYPYDPNPYDASLIDEVTGQVGAYGAQTEAFLSIEHISLNEFHVYTNALQGLIMAIF